MVVVLGGVSAVVLDFGTGSPVAATVPSHSLRLAYRAAVRRIWVPGGDIPDRATEWGAPQPVDHGCTLLSSSHESRRCRRLCSRPVPWSSRWCGSASAREGSTGREHRRGADAPRSRSFVTRRSRNRGIDDGGARARRVRLRLVDSNRSLHAAPVWIVVALLVWRGAPYTGTSLNPARSLGPVVVSGKWTDYWIYVVGPLAGVLVAVALWALVPRRTLTAKLFHDADIRAYFDPRCRSSVDVRWSRPARRWP
jgi:hypothetical protein